MLKNLIFKFFLEIFYFFRPTPGSHDVSSADKKGIDQSESGTCFQRSDSSPRCSESDSSFCSKHSLDSCQEVSVFHANNPASADHHASYDTSQTFGYKRQVSDSSIASGSGNSSPLLSSTHSVSEENRAYLTSTPNSGQDLKKVSAKQSSAVDSMPDRLLSRSPIIGNVQKKSRSMSADSPLAQDDNCNAPAHGSAEPKRRGASEGSSKEGVSDLTSSSCEKAQIDAPAPTVKQIGKQRLSHSFSHRHRYRRLSSCSTTATLNSPSHPSKSYFTSSSRTPASPPCTQDLGGDVLKIPTSKPAKVRRGTIAVAVRL